MLKQAWRSYLAALHPRNIKKIKGSSNGFWLLYLSCIWPMTAVGTLDDRSTKSVLLFYIKMIPLLIMGWSNISSRFLMTKEMYLCPMKREEREKYIKYVLYFKIGVPVLVGVIVESIWTIVTGVNILRSVVIIFLYVSICIDMYICLDTREKTNNRITLGRIDKNGKLKWAWMNFLSFVYGLMILFFCEETDFTTQVDLVDRVFIGFGLVMIAIFDVLIILFQYKHTIDQALDYEYAFNIKGKVEKNIYNLFAK